MDGWTDEWERSACIIGSSVLENMRTKDRNGESSECTSVYAGVCFFSDWVWVFEFRCVSVDVSHSQPFDAEAAPNERISIRRE